MAANISRNPNLLVLPFPAQGHISPALAFSKILASKGLKIIIITTKQLAKSAKVSLSSSSITMQTVSDGSSEDGQDQNETLDEFLARFRRCVSQELAKLLGEQIESGSAARAILYDSCLPWVFDIARGRGLLAVLFFTQSCSVIAVHYHLKNGSLKLPHADGVMSKMPALPRLEVGELPLFPEVMNPNNCVMNFLAGQFSNLEEVDWIFFNTFDKLEFEVIEWLSSRWPIKTIGPTISFLPTNEEVSEQKINDHMISIFEPTDDEACTEWLDSKEANSILYVSFGSVAQLKKEQMEELAFGLMMSNCHFLWVVRASEETKLPPDFACNRGLLVKWCSQPRILAHPAVSCFMTHCGWNSVLEALSCGVPIIGMAQWGDQLTNVKFIEDVWRVGVRVQGGDIKRREEIAKCVEQVVHGHKGKELKRNAWKWKELVEEAVGKGGTSSKNVDDFVSHILAG